ncbi:unnamed protein product [Ectocarpus sp. 6 AP-2014]
MKMDETLERLSQDMSQWNECHLHSYTCRISWRIDKSRGNAGNTGFSVRKDLKRLRYTWCSTYRYTELTYMLMHGTIVAFFLKHVRDFRVNPCVLKNKEHYRCPGVCCGEGTMLCM